MGNQIGPRQLEFPPNIQERESPAAYSTEYDCPPISTRHGFAR
jgi:hypothetical protein